jgi:c-di-GMP-binding flagellar brake protein YcgR
MFRWFSDSSPKPPAPPPLSPQSPHLDESLKIEIFSKPDQIAGLLEDVMAQRSVLAITLDGIGETYSSTILEVVRHQRYIVIDEIAPKEGNRAMHLHRGIHVRCRLHKVMVRFATTVGTAGQSGEATYYRLPFPAQIEHLQKREYYRASVPMERHVAVHVVAPGQQVLKAELRDISVGGFSASLRAGPPAALVQGAIMDRCVIALPEDKRVCGSAEVCYAGSSRIAGAFRFGARFVNLDRRDHKVLEQFIARMDREYRRRR